MTVYYTNPGGGADASAVPSAQRINAAPATNTDTVQVGTDTSSVHSSSLPQTRLVQLLSQSLPQQSTGQDPDGSLQLAAVHRLATERLAVDAVFGGWEAA